MSIKYFLFGWWYRWQACKLTAKVFSNRAHGSDDAMTPLMWSVTVFFESYMWYGSDWTADDFGPKEPAQLVAVDNAPSKASS